MVELGEPSKVPVSDDVELELVTLYAACIEPKLGGQLMKRLGPAAPLQGLQHAKRVRKSTSQPGRLEILLAAAPAAAEELSIAADGLDSEPTVLATLPPVVELLVREHSLQLHTVQVSRHAPKTREQALEWGEHWPLSWRPPDPTAHPQNAELPAVEVADMKRHMQRAWELAEANVERGGVCNACLIVDPRTGCVVAEAADARQHHPLHHAVMQAVAAVADWQLATWPQAATKHAEPLLGDTQQQQQQQHVPALDALDSKRRRLEGAHDVQDAVVSSEATQQRHASEQRHGREQAEAAGLVLVTRGGESGAQGHSNGMFPELPQLQERHSAGSIAEHEASNGVACTNVRGAVAGFMPHPTQPPAVAAAAAGCAPQGAADAQHSAGQAAEAAGATVAAAGAAVPGGIDPGPRPYLCTGYDCYVVQEPCVMCAMALVHSRLRRVVFCLPDAKGGALGGGAAKLHAQRSLNHRYHVYRLPLAAHLGELHDQGAV